jgi:hypothetical protein
MVPKREQVKNIHGALEFSGWTGSLPAAKLEALRPSVFNAKTQRRD